MPALSIVSMRASGGASLRRRRINRSSANREPHTRISTPCVSLATSPERPHSRAKRHTAGRKPTPCTRAAHAHLSALLARRPQRDTHDGWPRWIIIPVPLHFEDAQVTPHLRQAGHEEAHCRQHDEREDDHSEYRESSHIAPPARCRAAIGNSGVADSCVCVRACSASHSSTSESTTLTAASTAAATGSVSPILPSH